MNFATHTLFDIFIDLELSCWQSFGTASRYLTFVWHRCDFSSYLLWRSYSLFLMKLVADLAWPTLSALVCQLGLEACHWLVQGGLIECSLVHWLANQIIMIWRSSSLLTSCKRCESVLPLVLHEFRAACLGPALRLVASNITIPTFDHFMSAFVRQHLLKGYLLFMEDIFCKAHTVFKVWSMCLLFDIINQVWFFAINARSLCRSACIEHIWALLEAWRQ